LPAMMPNYAVSRVDLYLYLGGLDWQGMILKGDGKGEIMHEKASPAVRCEMVTHIVAHMLDPDGNIFGRYR